MPGSQSGSWTDLPLVTFRKRDGDAGGNHRVSPRRDPHQFARTECGVEVNSRRTTRLLPRQLETAAVIEIAKRDFDPAGHLKTSVADHGVKLFGQLRRAVDQINEG